MSKSSKILFDNITAGVRNNQVFEIESDTPPDISAEVFVYREFLTLNGDGVTTSMKVNGSTLPQEFYIISEDDVDIYIGSLCFFISAENVIADLNEFGAAPALTVGCDLEYQSRDTGTVQTASGIINNNEFMRLTNYAPSFGNLSGTGNRPFLLNNVYSNADNGYMPIIRFSNFGYVPEYRGGLRLRAGQKDRLIFRVNDNLSALTVSELAKLDCIAYGFRRKVSS
jgi:hypothetical protein